MNIAEKIYKGIKDTFSTLVHADGVQNDIPHRMMLEVENISKSLASFGLRKLHKAGAGGEFYEARPFEAGDEPSEHSARLSLQYRQPMAAKRQAEVSQHVYLWACRKSRMDYVSDHLKITARKAGHGGSEPLFAFSKKQAADILLLALAKHLCRNEEVVGLFEADGLYRSENSTAALSHALADLAGQEDGKTDMPVINRNLPPGSTAILFGDFIMEPDDLESSLDDLLDAGLSGFLVMVLDPAEITFDGFEGRIELKDMDGEARSVILENAAGQRQSIRDFMERHIQNVEKIAAKKGFGFVLQRTDRPLRNALLKIYGCTLEDEPSPVNKNAPRQP